jgi:Ca2+-binding RTX toxin-like protein
MEGQEDDNMIGGIGSLDIYQDENDKINGDSGNDLIEGGIGLDILKGSSGNDRIYQEYGGAFRINADGFKDEIDCGSGVDEAWINISVDGDTAVNCETVHSDINP